MPPQCHRAVISRHRGVVVVTLQLFNIPNRMRASCMRAPKAYGEVIVVSGGRVGTCTVANAIGRAALTPGRIAEVGPTSTK